MVLNETLLKLFSKQSFERNMSETEMHPKLTWYMYIYESFSLHAFLYPDFGTYYFIPEALFVHGIKCSLSRGKKAFFYSTARPMKLVVLMFALEYFHPSLLKLCTDCFNFLRRRNPICANCSQQLEIHYTFFLSLLFLQEIEKLA